VTENASFLIANSSYYKVVYFGIVLCHQLLFTKSVNKEHQGNVVLLDINRIQEQCTGLGAFKKLRKVTVSSIMSVCSYARIKDSAVPARILTDLSIF
jgi:hypothetical protein